MPILDLHAHYPMQFQLPGQSRLLKWANHWFNFERPGEPRVTLDKAHAGRLRGFASVLYHAPDELLKPRQPFQNLLDLARLVEERIESDDRFQFVRCGEELQRVVSENRRIAVFHCVEGAHPFNGPEQVQPLAKIGVAYVTLIHLFFRGIGGCANALPPLNDRFYDMFFRQPVRGLTDRGKAICEELFRENILVDITHCRDEAIDDVFQIQRRYPDRPVISSHTATREYNPAQLNISNHNIRRIQASRGVVGLIFFPRWLKTRRSRATKLDLLCLHIDHIAEVCGNFDTIAVGSDLDGFIRPLPGLEHLGKLGALEQHLRRRYGDAETEKILWKNALRVFRQGWRSSA